MTTLVRVLRRSVVDPIRPYETAKRSMDILFGVAGLVVFAVLLIPIAIAIRLDSPGPILYGQARVGRDGQVFRLLKFRSMRAGAERNGARWALCRDPRVTRVGRILRSCHLDELPQVLNLLRGQMAVVGPRPERPELLEKLAEVEPRYHRRHEVRPGLAGLAYMRQGYAGSVKEALERLTHDLEYLERRSFGFDLRVLAGSFARALRCTGR